MAEPVAARDSAAGQAARDGSYVDWGCVFAGAATSAAISFVLFTFGSGIGLSMVSPRAGAGFSMMAFVLVTSLWAVFGQVGAFAAGGYLAGRMRRPWKDATAHEVEFRDGAHGALVWAVGVGFGALLLAFSAAGAARTVVEVGSAATARSSATPVDATSYAVDALFRTTRVATDGRDADHRAEVARILAAGIRQRDVSPADRTYLAQLVAARTGLPQPEAEQRVNLVIENTKVAAERTRKIGIVATFLAAASLLAGCVAAWSAARIGGQHRDEGIVWRGFAGRDALSYRHTAVPRS